MSDHPFLRLLDLVNTDKEIYAIEEKQTQFNENIASLEKERHEKESALSDLEAKIFQLKKKIDEQELELKALEAKEADKKRCLEQLADYKEYQAIKNEIATTQGFQLAQEKIVLDLWKQLENAENDYRDKEHEIVEYRKKWQNSLVEVEQKQKELSMDFYRLVEQRKQKEGLVPHEWLEKYEMMRARVTDPVVEVTHDSCGACYQMLTQQDLVRAKRGALMQCKRCFRLLYIPEAMGA